MKPSKAVITPEGYPFIAYSSGLFLFLSAGAWLYASVALAVPALLTLLLVIFITSFFRNPERKPPVDESLMVAPADGSIVYVGPADEEHLGACQKISIFMTIFNVHVNRVPFSGVVIDSFYKTGKFYDVRHSRASCENEQSGLLIETAEGTRYVCVQVAGLIARRILCYTGVGEQLERGSRYGMIRFGSRLDIYFTEGFKPLVTMGQITVAGETPIAQFAEKPIGECA